MSRTLVVCEKPSVARDIAAALPQAFSRGGGCLQSDDVVITWAFGHLLEFAEPHHYDPEWKQWRLEHLPMLPQPFKLKPVSRGRDQLQTIKKLMSDPAVTRIVNACDAGREGELIFARLVTYARCRKPVSRLWLAAMTPAAVRHAFTQLEPEARYSGLRHAARCRAEADWIVGLNGSRAATLLLRDALGGPASLGRVQTPTLALLVARELEIRNFRPDTYWVVQAVFDAAAGSYPATFEAGRRLAGQQDADSVVARTRGQTGTVSSVQQAISSERPPMLYDLTALQREASRYFKMPAAKTLTVAQALYEQHKLISYPRTDCRWLSSEQATAIPGVFAALAADPASRSFVTACHAADPSRVTDDTKLSDHTAIIPTGAPASHTSLSADEQRIFELICRRTVAAMLGNAEFDTTTIVTTVDGDLSYVSKGRVMRDEGWRAAYRDVSFMAAEEHPLPNVNEGELAPCASVEAVKKQTQPPKRYADAGLLAAMETAGRSVDDDRLRDAMKGRGLGTPATRAAIIERLIKAGFVARSKNVLVPTDKAISLIGILDGHPITSPELTGAWEHRLLSMESGAEQPGQFDADLRQFASDLVKHLHVLAEQHTPEHRRPVGRCPACGQPVRRGPRSWSCWRPDHTGCGFAVWPTVAGVELAPAVVGELLQAGRTAAPVTGLRSKAGREFSAVLVLASDSDGRWGVRFEFV